jgi:hypothetical protein
MTPESSWIHHRRGSDTGANTAMDVKQGGVDQATGTELYFLLEQLPHIFPTTSGPHLGDWSRDGSMNLVLRSALPMATLQPAIAAAVREADPSLPIIRLPNAETTRHSVYQSLPDVDQVLFLNAEATGRPQQHCREASRQAHTNSDRCDDRHLGSVEQVLSH